MRNFNKYLKQTANVSCSNVSQTSKNAVKMQTKVKVKAKAKINKSAKAKVITLEKFDKEITSKYQQLATVVITHSNRNIDGCKTSLLWHKNCHD